MIRPQRIVTRMGSNPTRHMHAERYIIPFQTPRVEPYRAEDTYGDRLSVAHGLTMRPQHEAAAALQTPPRYMSTLYQNSCPNAMIFNEKAMMCQR